MFLKEFNGKYFPSKEDESMVNSWNWSGGGKGTFTYEEYSDGNGGYYSAFKSERTEKYLRLCGADRTGVCEGKDDDVPFWDAADPSTVSGNLAKFEMKRNPDAWYDNNFLDDGKVTPSLKDHLTTYEYALSGTNSNGGDGAFCTAKSANSDPDKDCEKIINTSDCRAENKCRVKGLSVSVRTKSTLPNGKGAMQTCAGPNCKGFCGGSSKGWARSNCLRAYLVCDGTENKMLIKIWAK